MRFCSTIATVPAVRRGRLRSGEGVGPEDSTGISVQISGVSPDLGSAHDGRWLKMFGNSEAVESKEVP